MSEVDHAGLLEFYRSHLQTSILPFWLERGVDRDRGGFFTCFDNNGERLVARSKYTWSQGRFAWVLARAADLARRGLLTLEVGPEELLALARRGLDFTRAHAALPDGSYAFVTTEDGEPFEPVPGGGLATSVFADCFVILGLAEYARASGDREAADDALRLYRNVQGRLDAGTFRTDPYPVPAGSVAFGPPMIMTNVAVELSALHPQLADDVARYADATLDLVASNDIGHEVRPAVADGSLLSRHRNPGHSVEAAWFVFAAAATAGPDRSAAWIEQARGLARRALELGWDDEHGGLLHYVDVDGGQPSGSAADGHFAELVRDTWDTKLWWPHSEALYTTLLGHRLTGDAQLAEWHRRVHDYTFRTFPAPGDREWIQIRRRDGSPLDEVVALPVKDPYHISRALMLIVELLAE